MLTAEQFREFLFASCHYEEGKPVLAAVSGGVDSVVLCDLLAKNKIGFAIAHVNYGLRGEESDGDEVFVAALAKKLNVPFYLYRCEKADFDSAGENSVQAAARNIRYSFFETACQQHGYTFIATAHHKDDSIETALLNFARGTGVKGLTGISPTNKKVIRPMLFTTRDEIVGYAKANQLEWREDSSNETDKYTRNKFRHHLLPWLKEEIPQSYKGFEASFRNLEELQQMVEAALENFQAACVSAEGDAVKISIDKLKRYISAEQHLKFFLKAYGFHTLSPGWYTALLNGAPGTEFISPTHRLIRDRDFLFLVKLNPGIPVDRSAFTYFTEEKPATFPDDKWETVVDSSLITLPLELRPWKNGDRFIPFGMKGHKNVSDILNEMKLPLHKKENAQVIVSNNEIVWVPGYRIADKFRVTEKTNSVIRLKFNPEKYGA